MPRSGHGPRPGSSASEGGGGDVSLEADLHRVLVHSRRVEDEMRHYGQVGEKGECIGWLGQSVQVS